MDRMAVDDDEDDGYEGPAADGHARQPDGVDGGNSSNKAANGPSSSAQPPDRPPSAAPSAPASGIAVVCPIMPGVNRGTHPAGTAC